jgi:hypothetical protein
MCPAAQMAVQQRLQPSFDSPRLHHPQNSRRKAAFLWMVEAGWNVKPNGFTAEAGMPERTSPQAMVLAQRG